MSTKIQLKNVKQQSLSVLQNELIYYANFISVNMINTHFLTAIMILDISTTLNYMLRNKIENDKKKYTISFSVSQASVIRQCINYNRQERDFLDIAVLELIKGQLDPQFMQL